MWFQRSCKFYLQKNHLQTNIKQPLNVMKGNLVKNNLGNGKHS